MQLTEPRALALLAGAVVLTFANTLAGGFVWDDELFFLRNTYMGSWANVPRFFSDSVVAGAGLDHNLYRPLQLLTHFLDLRVWGTAAWGHHLTNVALHTAASLLGLRVLLAFLGRRDAATLWAALLAALLYFLHPLQSFAVAYLSGRGDTLVLLFGFAAVLLFRTHFAASIACVAAALLSKENGVVVPLLVLAWDCVARHRGDVPRLAVPRHVVLFSMAAGYALLRLTLLDFRGSFAIGGPQGILAGDFPTRVLTYLATLVHGLRVYVLPTDLHHGRSFPIRESVLDPSVVLGALIVVAVAAGVIRGWSRFGPTTAGVAWALCATVPTSNLLVRINATCYDHWFLVPGFGLCIAVASRLSTTLSLRVRTLCAVLAILASGTTVFYNGIWRDPGTFYRHVLQYEPDSTPMLTNLAVHLTAEGRYEEAIALYERAIRSADVAAEPHFNLALMHLERRDVATARVELERALVLDPRFAPAHHMLGEIEIHAGNLPAAALHFERAVAIQPRAESHEYLAQIRERQGDSARARHHRVEAARYRQPAR